MDKNESTIYLVYVDDILAITDRQERNSSPFLHRLYNSFYLIQFNF